MNIVENRTKICSDILYEFLNRWTFDDVKRMTLKQYVSVNNQDTFCYWLETKTRQLGSIKGMPSWKFGISKRKNVSKKLKRLYTDNIYSWQKYYGRNRNKAFKKIKKEILEIIQCADRGQFELIDNFHLTQFAKWKIAYLYSNERLIPIFKKDVLIKIAKHLGFEANHHTPISEIQKVMISNKPAHLPINEYSDKLYSEFGRKNKGKIKLKEKRRRTTRRAAIEKNIKPQTRKGASSFIANQKHNILLEALKKKLEVKYGKKNVKMEENFVDIQVIQPDKKIYYEVKSSSYASDCIIQALGQILSYAQRDNKTCFIHLIVVGQYKPNEYEIEYINYIKNNLKLNFCYENIDLN